ncbi:exoribonuclease 2 [Candidatus Photodesmus katoptron]|uniref:exoribonuclease II n=1 Tax=Candidatus Photodesmus anomalopis TaxID=28176 RepID=UPI0004D68B49|nr:exoribonuclease II [Candidatus Photodesmus katoptron]KEY90697.1 exoribonuclease 2 [Candidatus Photodesmus katoptron]
MFQDNPLLAQLKKKLKKDLPKKIGVVKSTGKTFGFLEVLDSKTNFFIPPFYMKKCLHGDKVIANIHLTAEEKQIAEPKKLLEKSVTYFIGHIKLSKGKFVFLPDHPKYKMKLIKAQLKKGLSFESFCNNDLVFAYLIHHPLKGDKDFLVEISRKIANAKIAHWLTILAKNNLCNSEPISANNNWKLKDDADLKRFDMTTIPFITIDSKSTKDIDDALYIKKSNNGDFELTIAISDPTAYLLPEDNLDTLARKRSFTIYLPGLDIPILPRDLSENVCSLIENQVRPALCCTVLITKDGFILEKTIDFFAANIRSHACLVYDYVSDWIETGQSTDWCPNKAISDILTALYELSQVRLNWRKKNAVVFPEYPDYRFSLNENDDSIVIHSDIRRSAHHLIEESMIIANICAGKILNAKFSLGLFNIHAGFKQNKLYYITRFLNKKSTFPANSSELSTLNGFIALRHWLNNQDTNYFDYFIRKFQVHSKLNFLPSPHYAMGLDIYATWTSPIRKYSDMINHRMLKAYILDKKPVQIPDESLCKELNLSRKHHRIANRNVLDWLYGNALSQAPKNKIQFTAEIFDASCSGMRIRLLENGAIAFIPILFFGSKEDIKYSADSGSFFFNEKLIYQLGDKFKVVLVEVNQFNLIAKPI